MKNLPTLIVVLSSLISLSFCLEILDPNLLPRPLIVQPKDKEEARFQCTSWRFSVETNNVNGWKTIPEECSEYVAEYVTGRGYATDLFRVSEESRAHAATVGLAGDGLDAWIFDIDETLLSNLPYYVDHGYGYDFLTDSFD